MDREEMIRRLDAGEDPLEVSIVKWEEIRDGSTGGIKSSTCALCWNCNEHCNKCVVYKDTGRRVCHGTPWYDYARNKTKYSAGRMVMFLKSLREV